jgi:hypothetical protein
MAPRGLTAIPVFYQMACAVLAGWLVLANAPSLASAAPAAAPVEPGPAVAIADLEQLVRQLEDPQQRAELLKNLQALIAAAKQQPPGAR